MKFNSIIKVPMGLAGTSVGLGIVGKAFDSPGLTKGGEVAGNFIKPAIAIGVGGSLIQEVKKWKEVKK